jgi:hypothetical protein
MLKKIRLNILSSTHQQLIKFTQKITAIAIVFTLALVTLFQPLPAFAATPIANISNLPQLPSITNLNHPLIAALPSKSAIKDADTLLRNALPIKNKQIRKIQALLEEMPRQANRKQWRNLGSEIVPGYQSNC